MRDNALLFIKPLNKDASLHFAISEAHVSKQDAPNLQRIRSAIWNKATHMHHTIAPPDACGGSKYPATCRDRPAHGAQIVCSTGFTTVVHHLQQWFVHVCPLTWFVLLYQYCRGSTAMIWSLDAELVLEEQDTIQPCNGFLYVFVNCF